MMMAALAHVPQAQYHVPRFSSSVLGSVPAVSSTMKSRLCKKYIVLAIYTYLMVRALSWGHSDGHTWHQLIEINKLLN